MVKQVAFIAMLMVSAALSGCVTEIPDGESGASGAAVALAGLELASGTADGVGTSGPVDEVGGSGEEEPSDAQRRAKGVWPDILPWCFYRQVFCTLFCADLPDNPCFCDCMDGYGCRASFWSDEC